MKRSHLLRIVFSALFGFVLLALLLSRLSISGLAKMVSDVPLWYWMFGLLIYLTVTVIRALRFWVLIFGKIPLGEMIPITGIHLFLNALLPFRTGEASYVYLVRKTKKISGSEGLASLLIARIFDMIVVSLFFLTSAVFIQSVPSLMKQAIVAIAVFLGFLIIILFMLIFLKDTLLTLIRSICIRIGIGNSRITLFFLEKAASVVTYFNVMKSKRRILGIFLLTLLIWSLLYSMPFLLFKSIEVDVGLAKSIMGNTFLELSSILPIYTVGGVGVVEGAWSLAFISLGISTQIAISTGITYHLLLLTYIAITGALSFALRTKLSRKAKKDLEKGA